MATETKFTPGPWEVCALMPDYVMRVKTDENRRVSFTIACPMEATSDEDVDSLEVQEIARANARLIAAAPDLYAALEAIIAWEQSEDGPFAWEVLGQAKDALAKARGEA